MSLQASKFDPYFTWMRIPRREQPPNHYRLLGLPIFHTEASEIEAAAQRQAEHIRGCGKAKFSEIAEQLIAQIFAARDCLLEATAKAAYDEELKTHQPKPPLQRRTNRFDALQVGDRDSAALLEESASNSPAPAADYAEQDNVRMGAALGDKPLGEEAASRPATAIPPVSVASVAAPRPVSEISNTSVIKLAVGGCILAGGITYGLLAGFGSSGRPSAAEPTAALLLATVLPNVLPATAPILAPLSPVPAPVPLRVRPQAPSAKLAGTSWQITTESLKLLLMLLPDGSATISGAYEPGTWTFTGEDLNVLVAGSALHLEPVSDSEMLGLLSGIPAKAVRIKPAATRAAAAAKPNKAVKTAATAPTARR